MQSCKDTLFACVISPRALTIYSHVIHVIPEQLGGIEGIRFRPIVGAALDIAYRKVVTPPELAHLFDRYELSDEVIYAMRMPGRLNTPPEGWRAIHAPAPARWTLVYTKSNNRNSYTFNELAHLNPTCSGMTNPEPLLIHEHVFPLTSWCYHCKQQAVGNLYGAPTTGRVNDRRHEPNVG